MPQLNRGQQYQKFLTTITEDEITAAHVLGQQVGEPFENLVPGIVTVAVVDLFEMININQEDGILLLALPGLAAAEIEHRAEMAAVEKAGERVGALPVPPLPVPFPP